RPPPARQKPGSAARSICIPFGPGICRMDSRSATTLTLNAAIPVAKRGRRQPGSSLSTTMAAGVCCFPLTTPTPRGMALKTKVRTQASEGLDQYGVILDREDAAGAGAYNGFVGAWNGLPIPPQIVQNPDGSVDVNGDGKSNGIFMGSQNIGI